MNKSRNHLTNKFSLEAAIYTIKSQSFPVFDVAIPVLLLYRDYLSQFIRLSVINSTLIEDKETTPNHHIILTPEHKRAISLLVACLMSF